MSSLVNPHRYDTRGRIRPIGVERWALYAAFCQADSAGLVKIGVSSIPMGRAGQIHQGGQYPLEAFLWAWAGTKADAYQLEGLLHRMFEDRRIKGEWFRFDFANPDDKQLFHSTIKGAYQVMTGQPLVWNKAGLQAIQDFATARNALRAKPHVRKRRKPWGERC